MTLEEALQLIDSVCAQVQLNRQGHVQLQTAIAVILAKLQETAGGRVDGEIVPEKPEEDKEHESSEQTPRH